MSSDAAETNTQATSAALLPAVTPRPTLGVRVISLSGTPAPYVAQFPYQPRIFENYAHVSGGPTLFIQNCVWTPADADAAMTIYVTS